MTAVALPAHVARAQPADASAVRALARELAAHEGTLARLTMSEQPWGDLLADDDVIVLLARITPRRSATCPPSGWSTCIREGTSWPSTISSSCRTSGTRGSVPC